MSLKEYKASYVADLVGGDYACEEIIIDNFSSLSLANNRSVCFFNDHKYINDLKNTKAAIVILKKADANLRLGPSIYVEDPYLAFAKTAALFNKKSHKFFIHESLVLGINTKIGDNAFIGPHTSIGSNCNIGDNVQIDGNVFISDNVQIGNNVTLKSFVNIEKDVIIGNDCEFMSGARIGSDGFGYARSKDKKWIKIPQTGSVIIGNNVDIGANTTIDRGAIENTIIEDGVKIDNLVQVGHNCHIGENTIIAGCVGIAGSVRIGKNCMIGGAAMLKGHITIADDTIISGGTGIGKNIEESGKRFTNVFPYNIEHKDWLRIANNLKKIGKKND